MMMKHLPFVGVRVRVLSPYLSPTQDELCADGEGRYQSEVKRRSEYVREANGETRKARIRRGKNNVECEV